MTRAGVCHQTNRGRYAAASERAGDQLGMGTPHEQAHVFVLCETARSPEPGGINGLQDEGSFASFVVIKVSRRAVGTAPPVTRGAWYRSNSKQLKLCFSFYCATLNLSQPRRGVMVNWACASCCRRYGFPAAGFGVCSGPGGACGSCC